MVTSVKKFKINPQIVYDTIDGEVILLNIEKGIYYQLKNEAVQVWGELEHQKVASAFNIAASLAKSTGCSQNEVLHAISPFIDQLKAEQIIVIVPGTKSKNNDAPPSLKGQIKFPAPVLLKYTDMQSLLLLDPIHDTYKEGWPNKKKKNSK